MVQVIHGDTLRLYSGGEDITAMFAIDRQEPWFEIVGPVGIVDEYDYGTGQRHPFARADRRRYTVAVERGDTVRFRLATRYVSSALAVDDDAEVERALTAVKEGRTWPDDRPWFDREPHVIAAPGAGRGRVVRELMPFLLGCAALVMGWTSVLGDSPAAFVWGVAWIVLGVTLTGALAMRQVNRVLRREQDNA